MTDRLGRIVDSMFFRRFIIGVIVVAGGLVGLETYPSIVERHGALLKILDRIVVAIFVVEAAMKMGRHGRRFWLYFKDPWNVFDFVIVVLCLMPADYHYAAVMRLARLLRTLRLVSAVPRLQLLVSSLIKSLPSMGYVGGLLFLLFYVYGVLGVFLWQGNDPAHFGNLKLSMLSLFRVVTLEDWTDIMYIQMYGSDVYPAKAMPATGPDPEGAPIIAALYFVSFVLIGTMIMLNLFIGVIISSMHEAQQEQEQDANAGASPGHGGASDPDDLRAGGGERARDGGDPPEPTPDRSAGSPRELEAIERELAEIQRRLSRLRSADRTGRG